MRKTTTTVLGAALLIATLALVGCGGGTEESTAAGNPEQWAWLQETKAELETKRAALAEARAELAASQMDATDEADAEEGMDEGAEPADSGPGVGERISTLENEIADLSEDFATKLVEHINSLGLVEGEPLTPEQQQVIRMKSDEDIEVAAEWIEKGGDYRRAIDIYNTQLNLDPEYARLKEALARAEDMRYPTAERFAGVEKGMSQAEVREILGPVNLHNVREYPENSALAWFFPKDKELGANLPPSAVYFQSDDPEGCKRLKAECEEAEDSSACEAEADANPACTYFVYQTDYGDVPEEGDEEGGDA